MNEAITFGTWHKRRRKALGLTQDGLAHLVGCSAITIKKIESDDLRPSVQLAELMASHLQIPVNERAEFIAWARGRKVGGTMTMLETSWRGNTLSAATRRQISNLPAQLTNLIGRDQEIERACNLLRQPSTRVLTLTGPPGIGKTRLSIQIAAVERSGYADGVWFVPLAAVSNGAQIVSGVAQVLGVRELPGRQLPETMQEYLRDKRLLLVLDNFEHLIKATSIVREWLVAARDLKVIVTSREVLHLYGEQEFPVAPLALPDSHHLPTMDAINASPAVRLFLERAQSVKPDFVLSEDNAPVIVEICAWLDGIPLAIEMAAARIKWLMPRALLARLSQRLALLSSGPRDLSARQQTLRGAIDWSYELLDPLERRIFARFAVFSNGADEKAAQLVLDSDSPLSDAEIGNSDGVHRPEILNVLHSLTDKSLLHHAFPPGPNPAPRFMMLDTLKEYAYDKLSNNNEAWALRDRHLAYYMLWAEKNEPHLHGPDQITLLDQIETEHANLRAALDWALENGSAGLESGLRLAGAMGWFWRVHGHLSEGRRYLTALLKQAGTDNSGRLRARALTAAGLLAYYQADYTTAAAWFEESVAISRSIDDRAVLAQALHGLGNCCWYQGNQARSVSLHEESVATYRAIGDEWGAAMALSGLAGVLGFQGDYAASRLLFEESLAISAAIGDKWVEAFSLWNLADVMYGLEDYQSAGELYERSLPIARELGDRLNVAFVLAKLASLRVQNGNLEQLGGLASEALALFREMGDRWQPPFLLRMLGYLALSRGQYDEAARMAEESLSLNRELGDERGMLASVIAIASVAVARGDMEHLLSAARLFGAVDTLLDRTELHLLPPDARNLALNSSTLRDQLDSTGYRAAYAIGCSLDLRQAAALAMNRPYSNTPTLPL